jgi:hypothetical protein
MRAQCMLREQEEQAASMVQMLESYQGEPLQFLRWYVSLSLFCVTRFMSGV